MAQSRRRLFLVALRKKNKKKLGVNKQINIFLLKTVESRKSFKWPKFSSKRTSFRSLLCRTFGKKNARSLQAKLLLQIQACCEFFAPSLI